MIEGQGEKESVWEREGGGGGRERDKERAGERGREIVRGKERKRNTVTVTFQSVSGL